MDPAAPQSGQSQPPRGQPGSAGSVRVFGVPVRLHFTFIILLAFLILIGVGGGQSTLMSVLYIVALFASVLLHELGHVVVAKRYGIRTIEITMYPIGGVSRMERQPKPNEELWVSLAGPTVNLVLSAALLGYLYAWGQLVPFAHLFAPSDKNLLQRIAMGNLILAAFNLIPAFPMDGGRVLRAILARSRPAEEATRMAAKAGMMLAFVMLLVGVFSMQFMLVFIAFFVYLGASQEQVVAVGRSLAHGVPVRAAMVKEFHTLSHGNSVRDAADLLLATSQQDFPVVLGNQVIGLLGRTALLRGMATEGPDAYVAGIMNRNFAKVDPEMDLADAIPVLGEAGNCVLVMHDEDLVGLLTRENLSEFLLLRRFGMQAPVASA